ncbi:hypothetical protein SAMN04488693_11736 [Arthrobacter subterraneus]|uniref:Uncharacterized protein n=1 Tax=Arthrobacter subterraneus TaxID=335973 RepID=A0A1G8MD25_9MICC|nr:hypothetical protein SAMN04488693_11736 [Arthrobacter subterraneus]
MGFRRPGVMRLSHLLFSLAAHGPPNPFRGLLAMSPGVRTLARALSRIVETQFHGMGVR